MVQQYVGEMLAAVGNHEGKALLYLAMRPGEPDGFTDLHRLWLGIQPGDPVFAGTKGLPAKYCVHSLGPAGLVEQAEELEHGWRQWVRPARASQVPAAIAGFLLTATEAHPAGLSQIFGKTATTDGTGKADPVLAVRETAVSTLRRLAMARALARSDGPAHASAAALTAGGMTDTKAGTILAEFSRHGLLTYRSAAGYQPRLPYEVAYRIARPLPGGGPLQAAIANYIYRSVARAGGGSEVGTVIARSAIVAHIATLPRWQEARMPLTVHMALRRLADRGCLTLVEDYHDPHQPEIVVTPAQRAFFGQLAGGLDAIAAGDEAAIAQGVKQAREITGDTRRVRALLSKAFSPAVNKKVTPVPLPAKESQVLAALAAGDGITTDVLHERLGTGMTKKNLHQVLRSLVRQRRITGIQQDGCVRLPARRHRRHPRPVPHQAVRRALGTVRHRRLRLIGRHRRHPSRTPRYCQLIAAAAPGVSHAADAGPSHPRLYHPGATAISVKGTRAGNSRPQSRPAARPARSGGPNLGY